jgi:hypothetical protein
MKKKNRKKCEINNNQWKVWIFLMWQKGIEILEIINQIDGNQ